MQRLISLMAVAAFSMSLAAAPPAKIAVDSELKVLEDNFSAAADRIERDSRRQKAQASDKRLEGYRAALKTATKAGDFDKATRVKARIVELESMQPGQRAVRPKETLRFKGHTYAIIKDPSTWHVAKRKCEEMGGHLAVFDTAAESEFLKNLCRNPRITAWVGGTDEEIEGDWRWVTGEKITLPFRHDNFHEREHSMCFYGEMNDWEDLCGDARIWFICEWE